MARLSNADQSRLPLSRLDPRRAHRTRSHTLPRSRPANAGTTPARHSGMAELLLQVSHDRARAVSRARSVHPTDEAEEYAAAFEGRRTDHALGIGILRLACVARALLPAFLSSATHQTVLSKGLRRIFSSRVTNVSPSARAVAPIMRSAGSRG